MSPITARSGTLRKFVESSFAITNGYITWLLTYNVYFCVAVKHWLVIILFWEKNKIVIFITSFS